MSRLQRFPQGLLSALDAKTLGRNPPDYLDHVGIEFDATEQYLAQTLRFVFSATGTPGAANGANIGPITVPNDETWILRNINFLAGFLGVASTVRLGIHILIPGAPLTAHLVTSSRQYVLGAAGSTANVSWNGRLQIGPGTQVFGIFNELSANTSGSVALLAHVLKT